MAGMGNGHRSEPQGVVNLRSAVEESLREREISWSTLARIAPVGILRFDAQGRCNYANERWCEMAEFTIDEAIGEGWIKAIHIEDRASVAYQWESMRQNNVGFQEEYRVCRKDGSIRWVTGEGAALRGYAGEPLGFIRTVTDITRHRELEAELLGAREALEQRVRERTAELRAEIREREKLEKEVLHARDEEQRRFSQDLHDGLGQYLIGIEFRVSALQRDLETAQPASARHAAEIVGLVKEASRQAHDLARGVHPVPLRADGLMTALQGLVEKLCQAAKTHCAFECEEPVLLADNTVATHLYRIAQEAITNSMKYSRATSIALRLRRDGEMIELSIKDNGDGFDPDARCANGRGLNIMKHRARIIGGSLQIAAVSGGGCVVRCKFHPRPGIA